MATKAKKKPAAKAKPAAAKNKKAAKAKVVKPAKKAAKPVKKAVVKKATPKKAAPKAKPVAKVVKKAIKPVVKVKVKVAVKPAPKAAKKQEVIKPVAKVIAKAAPVKEIKPVKGAKEDVKASATAAIKHVEKPTERPRRRSRGNAPFIKPTPPPRTTPLRIDPILPNTPVKSSLKKPVAMLNNNTAKPANSPDKTRYSDSELAEFRALIVQKVSDAKSELTNLQTLLNNSDNHGTDDTASSFKMLEDGSDTLAKEEAGQLAARQRKFIEQLENALVRIENKTYGVCRVTGKLIPKERLRAVPHTTQSIEAKVQQYRD
jgi:RNA polymerase-binding transcription factor DksA